jgi:hypothetical protein
MIPKGQNWSSRLRRLSGRIEMKRAVSVALVAVLAAVAAAWAEDAAPSLLVNGDFEASTKEAIWPDGWPRAPGVTWELEDGNHFLRLRSEKPGQTVLVYLAVPIQPEHKALELSYRVRYAEIKPGKESWFDGRIMMNFRDDAKQMAKPGPAHPNFRGTSKGWQERRQKFLVPQGAKVLEIMPTLFQAEGGTLDFDDVRLVSISASEVPPPPPPPPIIPSETMTPADTKSLPPELRVVGNQLKTPDGKAVWLQGLAVPSMEWSAAGENILQSIKVGVEQWKANVIRLPVKDDFWFGRGKGQKDGGMAYRKLVDAAADAAGSRGAYLVLDLHRFGAPLQEHVDFWKDAATRYRNHPAVLFDLFNEAHDISWETWLRGGAIDAKGKGIADVNPAENAGKPSGRRSPGMQALVDAVRAAGARNIVIAGGLDWGYDLSGAVQGFALEERAGGNGIMYSSHIYPWKKDWQAKALAAAERYPLFIGEVGCPPERLPFIPPEQHEDPYTWAPDVLGLIQKYRLNWTAWCFHPKAAPMAISDWQYTPTLYWGAFVKDALSGKQFELKKMR